MHRFILSILCFCIVISSISAQTGHSIYRDTFCNNQTVFVINQFFDAAHPSADITLPGAAQGGLDSVIHVELTFNPAKEFTLTQTLCEGDTLWVNGTPYHAGFYIGEEFIEGGAANGCDSLIHVQLSFRKVYHDFEQPICEGDSILINGHFYSAFNRDGIEVIPNGACDSIIRVHLTAVPIPYSIVYDTLCPGEQRIINGHVYDAVNRTGNEILANAGANGCDSLIQIKITMRELWVYVGEDREIIKGDTICIQEQFGMNPVNLQWLPTPPCPDSSCFTQCIMPLQTVSFELVATDSTGCILRDKIQIRVSNKNRIFAPNVFNPDLNWPNNRFFLGADNGVSIIRRLFIADRWGELLFDVKDIPPDYPDYGWDGTYRGQIMHSDTYIYWAEIERIDGTTFTKSGSFALIR